MDRFQTPRKPNVLILIGGIVSSAVCLLLVHLLNKTGFELMLFFLWHVIPVGAVGIGDREAIPGTIYGVARKSSREDGRVDACAAIEQVAGRAPAQRIVTLIAEGFGAHVERRPVEDIVARCINKVGDEDFVFFRQCRSSLNCSEPNPRCD